MPFPVLEPRTEDALSRAAAAGQYFAIELDTGQGAWRRFDELVTPAMLRANVAGVQRTLSERTRLPLTEFDVRACSSTHFLALVARILAPAVGAAALVGHVPEFTSSNLSWRQAHAGPIALAVTAGGGRDVDTASQAAVELGLGLFHTVIAPLAAAFRDTFALSPHVLWGNVASALNGAATMVTRSALPCVIDPQALVQAALDDAWLLGRASVHEGMFRRHNCCLFYRIPGGGKCGDCVLISEATRRGI